MCVSVVDSMAGDDGIRLTPSLRSKRGYSHYFLWLFVHIELPRCLVSCPATSQIVYDMSYEVLNSLNHNTDPVVILMNNVVFLYCFLGYIY